MFKRKIGYLGFAGFASFAAFDFFTSHNTADLGYLCFLGFFAYFWIAKIGVSIPDERYYEDSKLAKAFAFNIAINELIILVLAAIFIPSIREYLIAGVALCYSSLLIIYAIKFYTLEEK